MTLEQQIDILEENTYDIIDQRLYPTIRLVTYKVKNFIDTVTKEDGHYPILCLKGLRYSGKTTAFLQLVQYYIGKGKKVLYIDALSCSLDYVKLSTVLAKRNYDIIFLDEACKISDVYDLIPTLTCLSESVKIILTGSSSMNITRLSDSLENSILYSITEYLYYEYLMFKAHPEMNLEHSPYKVLNIYEAEEISTMDELLYRVLESDFFIAANNSVRDTAAIALDQINDNMMDTLRSNYNRYGESGDYNLRDIKLVLKIAYIYLKYTFNPQNLKVPSGLSLIKEISNKINGEQSELVENLLTSDELETLHKLNPETFNSSCFFLYESGLLYIFPSWYKYCRDECDTNKRTIITKTLCLTRYFFHELFFDTLNLQKSEKPPTDTNATEFLDFNDETLITTSSNSPIEPFSPTSTVVTASSILWSDNSSEFKGALAEVLVADALTNLYYEFNIKSYRDKDQREVDLLIDRRVENNGFSIGFEVKSGRAKNVKTSKLRKYKDIANDLGLNEIAIICSDAIGINNKCPVKIPFIRLDVLILFLESLQLEDDVYNIDDYIVSFIDQIKAHEYVELKESNEDYDEDNSGIKEF